MRTSDFVTVATLLRSPYHLIYALPLLFLSIPLLFAGTFLTLDRTRSFASSPDVKKPDPFYRLESGIGGLATGWVLAVHSTTLLSLLILNQTETAHLSPPAFLVVWLLSAIGLTLVCGRWKYAALTLGGILGGACTGLILAISLHPSLLARLVLTLMATVMLSGGALLPFPVVRHTSLRIATSATGAAGIINACAILGSSAASNKLASWANAWLHLILAHDSDSAELQWGTGKSKGLTAACYFLWMIGAACDWYLKQRIGEDPDEAWDKMLGSYTTTFPPQASRSGSFTPIMSRWTALKEWLLPNVNYNRVEKPSLLPPDSQLAPTLPEFHQNTKAPPVFRPRIPGSFNPNAYDSDSDSDLGEGEKTLRRTHNEKKWTVSTNYSDATLVNPGALHRHQGLGQAFQPPPFLTESPSGSYIEYGDKDAERSPELNIGPHRIEPSKDDDKNWRPVFLKRSDSIRSDKAEMIEDGSQDVTTMAPVALYSPDGRPYNPGPVQQGSGTGHGFYSPVDSSSTAPGLVRATPSLVRALDRVSRAQRQANVGGRMGGESDKSDGTLSRNRDDMHPIARDRIEHREGDRWKGFWSDVQRKAAEP